LWALANYPDSAFSNLYHITNFNNYTNYNHIKSGSDLKSLYGDKRWQTLVDAIKKNRIRVYGNIELILVNGFKLEVASSGLENNREGKPVIVFENGMASDFDSWKAIINEMSKTSAVLAYNRPRIGESEDDSVLPTMKHIVDKLRQLLIAKGLNPPYLLVSH